VDDDALDAAAALVAGDGGVERVVCDGLFCGLDPGDGARRFADGFGIAA
jgi:hypothetical protein